MIEYFIAILIVLAGFILTDNNQNNGLKKLFIIVIWIYLTLLIGLRFMVGGDTLNYMGDYIWRDSLNEWEFNLSDAYQPGYTLLCAIAKTISPDFFLFQLIHAAIVNTFLFVFINRYTRYFFAALLSVFFTCYFYFSTEILREVIAVLLFVLNYRSFIEKRWLRYYLGILLCCCFHISAIFLVLLPLLRGIKINNKFFVIFFITLVSMFFLRPILNLLADISFIGDKVNSYKNMTSVGLLADLLSTTRSSLFPLLFCIVVKYVCRREVKFENMIAIMSIFGLASFFSPIIFNRAANYFILFFSVSIADFCVEYLKRGTKVLSQYATVLSICFFMLYGSEYVMYRKYTRWIPYYSILNPVTVDRDNYGDR